MRFEVKEVLSKTDVQSGLRSFVKDALATYTMNSFTAPTLIVAFALLLGASNFAIGLLAAIPFLSQLVQIPAIYLVEKCQVRRVSYNQSP